MYDRWKEGDFFASSITRSVERATLKFRGDAVTQFRIFDRIFTPALLREPYAAIPSITRQYQMRKFYKVSLRCIYISFAIYCKIQGEYNKPAKAKRCPRPLETAVNKALKYLQSLCPTTQIPNTKTILKLFSYYLFDYERYEKLSNNCQSLLHHMLLEVKIYSITPGSLSSRHD